MDRVDVRSLDQDALRPFLQELGGRHAAREEARLQLESLVAIDPGEMDRDALACGGHARDRAGESDVHLPLGRAATQLADRVRRACCVGSGEAGRPHEAEDLAHGQAVEAGRLLRLLLLQECEKAGEIGGHRRISSAW
jgi:hypothetical protein